MSDERQSVEPQLLERLGMDAEKYNVLRQVVAPQATPQELILFADWCRVRGLDPTMGQAHFIAYGKDEKREVSFQVSIDGLRLLADESGDYRPGRTAQIELDAKGNLVSATAYVERRYLGEWHEVSETRYFAEMVQDTRPWRKMPRLMLIKCAEAAVLRKAFPRRFAGIYTPDEMPEPQQRAIGDVEQEPRVLAAVADPEVDEEAEEEAAEGKRLEQWRLDAGKRLLGAIKDLIPLSGDRGKQARQALYVEACKQKGWAPAPIGDLTPEAMETLLGVLAEDGDSLTEAVLSRFDDPPEELVMAQPEG